MPCFFIGTPGGVGAVCRHFEALGMELMRRGNIVKMISSPSVSNLVNSGGNLSYLTWPSRRPTRWQDALFLARLIRTYRPDCLIANFGAVNWMCLIGRFLGVRNRIAFYHTLTSQINRDNKTSRRRLAALRWRKRLVYRASTCVVANSRSACEDIQKSYSVPSRKCMVWRNSIEDPVQQLMLVVNGERENLIVCAGRLHRSKGQDVLIEALALCGSRMVETRVEFLGSGPMLENLRQMTEQHHVADRCTFVGTVPREEVLRRMAQSKVTVVPSRNEAFGLVNIESMAVETPVIASHVDGIPEIIRDGLDGCLVPADDPNALAEKLILLLGDNRLRERMGLSARQRFLEQYEDRGVVRQQADWLEALVTPRDSGAPIRCEEAIARR